ncbi:DUF418 domain-containing protein [Streptomyces sp. NPDC049585]|uniref:DUF418 domain-containing protein n=1 Tax=Streptomyces sp. NPDC049585 TaxID=3155154 RepID=UPI00343BADFC
MTETVRSTVSWSGPQEDETEGAPDSGTPQRLPLLDVLRGTAILGTLMTNVWIFTGPGAEWGVLEADGGATLGGLLRDPTPALAVESVFRFLADGKFLSLLTLLFGVGLAIQFDAAARRGRPWPGRYRRRALFLLAEGTVHFVLVFAWDVLMGYALTALLVARLLNCSARLRNRVMWTAAGLHVAVMTLLGLAALGSDGDGSSSTGPDREAADLYAHGGYLAQIAFRLHHALVLRMEPVLSFGLLLFLFLLGVRLHRAGAFAPSAAGHRLRVRLAAWGLGLGLPLNAAASLADAYLLGRYVAAPVVALGYLGLIGVLMDRLPRPGPLTRSLTSVGRMALTCYVAQNVLCVLACYGIGLGLADHFAGTGPWWVLALWATVCLTLVTASTLWMRRFSAGPLESLQKRLLRG